MAEAFYVRHCRFEDFSWMDRNGLITSQKVQVIADGLSNQKPVEGTLVQMREPPNSQRVFQADWKRREPQACCFFRPARC
jgi:hypothetical protein